ncbi:electron transfer flavoprotein subunit alpha/FixB family protein [Nocardiopsis gilva YIM 90087]|uniref:Electron transfer flavoprotein subunit alpha/FixB family protein n=1 Tax=Nocardiopsis gilva YIM 90087 TaxID=1235441 RepID=A0A223S7N6_9ACTN|nr:mycofactocin-associated electron transfer flavoprotein alpha subunit [Nocardiopsis gilva]ASU84123.1 electron transfer flavoprotein subunit alpha/FixB family protein [Nocardiopsis gilva YIM 90087]
MTSSAHPSASHALPAGRPLAVVHARDGALPAGADEAVAEARGHALVVGSGARDAAEELRGVAVRSWYAETGARAGPAALLGGLVDAVRDIPLVICPASPDGRDLAPRLAAACGRALLAGAIRVGFDPVSGVVAAELERLQGRVIVDADAPAPAVATLLPGARTVAPAADGVGSVEPVPIALPVASARDAQSLGVTDPRPESRELGEAARVLGGGAGLVPRGTVADEARRTFDRLVRVAARLDASAGATRVATDAGWMDPDRQIGITGAMIGPELYIAFGISGASQHTGGLGAPRHIVSVNTDPACPMTRRADLGLVTDARALLEALECRMREEAPDP